MQKIAILTDSGCDLPKEVLSNHNIKLLPFRIIYKDKEFLDILEISPDEVYDSLHIEIPTTSLPDIKYMDNVLKGLKLEGYTHIIAITISNGLSGTNNSLRIVLEDHPEFKYHIFDTLTLSRPQGETALYASKMVAQGCSFEEIVRELPIIQKRLKAFYTIKTLEYLRKGGRIGKVAGTIGELLNIKPIISIDETGVYYTHAKTRGRKQSISKLKAIAESYCSEGKCNIWVLDGGSNEEALSLLEDIKTLPNVLNCSISKLGPALGVHTGAGLIGITVEAVETGRV